MLICIAHPRKLTSLYAKLFQTFIFSSSLSSGPVGDKKKQDNKKPEDEEDAEESESEDISADEGEGEEEED